ncbi:hypothetical protein KAR91_62225 [Candidatus Pacearchaeota archaeon]|nr:hypothetical protein [Candidatus Pacearchaeota archaeon]
MKKKVEVVEVEDEGLVKLIGERVTLFCLNYFYTGDLIGVNDDCVLIQNGGIVFNTGDYSTKEWEDYQKLPNEFYVRIPMIEAYGIVK